MLLSYTESCVFKQPSRNVCANRATQLICVEIVRAVDLNAAAQEHKLEVVVLRSQSPSFEGQKDAD